MPSWDAEQYLRFEAERTRPCAELAQRIALEPARVIDLGCGPGNSTGALAKRWPKATLTGLDASPAMIEAARKSMVRAEWISADIGAWARAPGEGFDLVFSNAALHWLADHQGLMPVLMRKVAQGGAFAFQVPMNVGAPAHVAARELAASLAWRAQFPVPVREWSVLAPEAYFDLLAPHAKRVDLWTTQYFQVMENVSAILEWYRGSGLRPYLDALPTAPLRARFEADYTALLAKAFPVRPSGQVLFPFERLFAIAYRG